MNVTSGSLNFAEGLLEVFQSWNLKTDITEIIPQHVNVIYRIWVRGKLEYKSFLKLSTKSKFRGFPYL